MQRSQGKAIKRALFRLLLQLSMVSGSRSANSSLAWYSADTKAMPQSGLARPRWPPPLQRAVVGEMSLLGALLTKAAQHCWAMAWACTAPTSASWRPAPNKPACFRSCLKTPCLTTGLPPQDLDRPTRQDVLYPAVQWDLWLHQAGRVRVRPLWRRAQLHFHLGCTGYVSGCRLQGELPVRAGCPSLSKHPESCP